MKCCICGKELTIKYPHNPWPVETEGGCCEECEMSYVLLARMRKLTPENKEGIAQLKKDVQEWKKNVEIPEIEEVEQ